MIIKKKKNNFLFYDYETFGLNPALDKVAQFACVRTDTKFNFISDPIVLYCYPPNDYIPNIQSMLITKITPQYTFKYGINEFFFSKKIFNILNVHNTCIIGYNNIKFDDEITRNIFYRNLLDSYSWSWKHHNSRWDVLPIIIACYVLSPYGICWPKDKYGKISFKLQDLTYSNNIIHDKMHDALSDVYATVNLIKLIKQKKPELFNFLFKYRLKNNIKKLIDIKNRIPILFISQIFGKRRNYISCIIPILWNINNNNMLVFFDLHYDIINLIKYFKNIHTNDINLYTLRKLGLNFLYINQCPILIPINILNISKLLKLGINVDICLKKIHLFYKDIFFINKIHIFFKSYCYKNFNTDVDCRIYDNFYTKKDQNIMHIIHNISFNKLHNKKFNFYDVRLEEIFFRLRARNFPNLLCLKEQEKWLLHRLHVFNKNNFNDYLIILKHLYYKYHNNIKIMHVLKDIKNYIIQLFI